MVQLGGVAWLWRGAAALSECSGAARVPAPFTSSHTGDKYSPMVRRSRRIEGAPLKSRRASSASGILRYFPDTAGQPAPKMAPPEKQSETEGAQSQPTTSHLQTGGRDPQSSRLPAVGRNRSLAPSSPSKQPGDTGTKASPPPPPSSQSRHMATSPPQSAIDSHGDRADSCSLHITSAGAGIGCVNPLTSPSAVMQAPSSSSSFTGDKNTAHLSLQPHTPLTGDGIQELRQQLAAIPTKMDMEGYIKRLESAYKSEIQALTNNISKVSDQVQRIEGEVAAVSSHQETQDNVITQHTQQIHMLFAIAEDHENRNRRNNLRIRGIPETISTAQILPTLKRLFNDLLETEETSPIEIDRAHRTLGPKNQDPNRPRDILCRLHYFTVKEQILRKARDRGNILLDGCQIQLLADLSKMTLDKRRALRPLLDMLREHSISYSWGYPFQLQVRLDGSLLLVRTPADVPDFCSALRLPTVTIRDWPYVPLPPQRPVQRRRGRSPPSPHGPPRGRRASPR